MTTAAEKYAEEINFWTQELNRYVVWYSGGMRDFYGIPTPAPEARITRFSDIRMNALETWVLADKWRYCKHLMLEPTYFTGQSVLEIGCGPLRLSRWFTDATVTGLDPLFDQYEVAGYPVVPHKLQAHAESIPVADDTFDAAFSVNAIDHVDDFEKAIAEVERVVKPSGEIRIEVHYHNATVTEPLVLHDARVAAAFKKFRVLKIHETASTTFYPPGTHPKSDRFALWSNVAHKYNAIVGLR